MIWRLLRPDYATTGRFRGTVWQYHLPSLGGRSSYLFELTENALAFRRLGFSVLELHPNEVAFVDRDEHVVMGELRCRLDVAGGSRDLVLGVPPRVVDDLRAWCRLPL